MVVVVVWCGVCVCVCVCVYFFAPCRKFGSSYLSQAQQPHEQRYPLLSVCAVFSCVQTMVWLPALGFLTCAKMLMHAIAHRGLYGHRKRVCTES